MMRNTILVVGATGDLGMRICRELIHRNVEVRAIVRKSADTEKIERLKKMGVIVREIDFDIIDDIAAASIDVSCIISAVAGLSDVIIDLQKNVLEGAIRAGVPGFIPSDFCTNYNHLVPGENRNFDLRREFKNYIDKAPIKVSSVFTGAFAEILRYNTPVLNFKTKTVGYWGEKDDWQLDFTTKDDTAAFTAEVALDDHAKRDFQIASFQVSPNQIVKIVENKIGESFSIARISGMEEFARFLKKQRADNPAGENELYAKWQQGQYLYSMFSTQHDQLDNDRYKSLSWTSAEFYLGSIAM